MVAQTENPFGYGRIVAKNDGCLEKIVEEKDATPSEKQIKTINSGIYCFDKNLWKLCQNWNQIMQRRNII